MVVKAVPPRAVVTVIDAYLPLRELARYSGISVRRLRAYLTDATHPLPHYRVGGKVLVKRSEFDGWIAKFRGVDDAHQAAVDAITDTALAVLRGRG